MVVEQTVVVPQTVVVTPTAEPARSHITMVFGDVPTLLGVWGSDAVAGDTLSGPGCTISPVHAACQDLATDVLTYLDSETFEVVPLSGTESWEQVADDRWRFNLTPGVKFHNGEDWNAAAAKQGIDIEGSEDIGQSSHSYTGTITGEVVDDLTVDVVCEISCPILPRSAFLIGFQAPGWWNSESTTPLERTQITIGFGPYKQTEYRRSRHIKFEKYEDYIPNEMAPNDAQAPTIDEITIEWRSESLVRASMVGVGEADWAMNLNLEHKNSVPVFKTGGAAETFVNVYDTIWHPELSKRDVRLALAHATNCDLIVEQFYEGLFTCQGTYAPPGTLGITPRTLAQYEYDPAKARDLLAAANYDPANEITINVFQGRYPNNVELSEAQAGMWEEVGVSANVVVLETGRWLDVARTGCGRAFREHKGEDPGDTYCLDVPPGPPCFCQPNSFQLNPSLETLDFARALGRMDCGSSSAKFCDPVNIQPLLDPAREARLDGSPSRQELMQYLVDFAYDQAIIYTYFDALVFYGSSANLDWEPRFDRRMRPNNWTLN
jgi:ABC-type transport system substrate-binding protein